MPPTARFVRAASRFQLDRAVNRANGTREPALAGKILMSEPMQRVGPLAGIPDLLQEFGIEINQVLSGMDIRREDLFADNRIPFRFALDLLNRSAKASSCDHFGALLGTRFKFSAFGSVGEVLKCASTLGEAVEDFVSFQIGFSQGLCWYFIPFGDCAAFGAAIYDRKNEGRDQVYGLNVAFAINAIRVLSNGDVHPLEAHFNHRPPSNPAAYHNLLKCPILFNQDQTCLLLSRKSLEWKNPRADAGRREQFLTAIRKAASIDQLPTLMRLRHELRPMFSRNITSLEVAAEQLAMHPRALNRRLEQEGTTFAEERDRARYLMARELLDATDLPVGEIAAAVAYENHSAFVRAFRKWSGYSPTEWRDRSSGAYDLGERAAAQGQLPN